MEGDPKAIRAASLLHPKHHTFCRTVVVLVPRAPCNGDSRLYLRFVMEEKQIKSEKIKNMFN